MDIRLLGTLEVADNQGDPVVIRGQRSPAVLAMLALRPGQPVAVGQLIQALWGTQPPRTARESVHFFVRRLRKAVGPATVRTRGTSYLLQVRPEQVDVGRFGQLVDHARAAQTRGELEAAWERFGEALGLWRGDRAGGLHRRTVRPGGTCPVGGPAAGRGRGPAPGRAGARAARGPGRGTGGA